MNNTEKKSKIPEAPVPSGASGNLLSSIAPPSELPNFVTSTNVPEPIPSISQPALQPSHTATSMPQPPASISQPTQIASHTPEKFSPAIPLSKGEPTLPIRSPADSQSNTQSPMSLPGSTPDRDRIGDPMPGSGLLTWMKGAVSSGGIFHRVAEKAKSSVDSMITTLDPQMKEYLNSGGDTFVVVASDNEIEVTPVREAIQCVFGKATVIGYPAPSEARGGAQCVGYASAHAAAVQRLADLRAARPDLNNNVPLVALQSYIYEAMPDRWYESSVLVLTRPSLGVELQAVSQGAPVPAAAVAARDGATVAAVMATNLQVQPSQWQEATTGVSRRESLTLAAKSLAFSYKKMLNISAAES